MTTDAPAPHGASDPPATPAAKPPVGSGSAPLVAQLVALGLVVLGALAVQDAVARWGLVSQDPALDAATGAADGLAADSPAVLVFGIASAVLGLLLLGVALRRSRRTLEMRATTGVRVRTRDLPRLLRARLEIVDGVTGLDVRARRRRVRVVAATVVRSQRRDEVAATLRGHATEALAGLERPPRVRVRVKGGTA